MQVVYACEPSPGHDNEDVVVAGPTWAAVLDGATAQPGRNSGCRHGVAWYARRLGAHLAATLMVDDQQTLTDALATAIAATRPDHGGECDLDNPDSPNSTVVILRQRGAALDYLVLIDSPLVLDLGSEIRVVADDQIARLRAALPAGTPLRRNSPGGFWIAGAKPEAATHALTGTVPAADVRAAALLSDGASRLVERFGALDWPQLMGILSAEGPAALIARTRAAERAADADLATRKPGKVHDDATAVYITF
jgi:hypothetical protein